jgi:CMP-N,N'-diacetyllegionaminic acid synthase
MNKATAIVVARGGSVRLPKKAMLPFGGTSMIGHKVLTLKACPRIGRVIVGSDSDAILHEAGQFGAACVRRSDKACDEKVTSANDMIRDMIGRVSGDDDEVIVWAHPTNPLVRSETYTAAIEAYESAWVRNEADSLASVTEVRRHCWSNRHPINYDPWSGKHTPASDLSPLLFQDGAIFIQTLGRFRANGYFFGERPLLFPVDWREGWDIDTADDYRVARALCELRC